MSLLCYWMSNLAPPNTPGRTPLRIIQLPCYRLNLCKSGIVNRLASQTFSGLFSTRHVYLKVCIRSRDLSGNVCRLIRSLGIPENAGQTVLQTREDSRHPKGAEICGRQPRQQAWLRRMESKLEIVSKVNVLRFEDCILYIKLKLRIPSNSQFLVDFFNPVFQD